MFESLKFWEKKSANESQWQTLMNIPTFGGGTSRPRLTFQQLRSFYRGWVFACVNVRGKAVGNIQLELYKKDKKGDDVEVKSHPILDMLYAINESTTKRSAFSLVSKHLDMYGKAFWDISDKKRIISKHPKYMSAVYDEDMQVVGWVYKRNIKGREVERVYKLEEIIYFKEDDPTDDGATQSLVEGGYEWIEAEINATDWNRVFFKNNATPAFLIESPIAMQPEAVKRLKQSYEESYGGIENAHRTGILPVGAKIHELSNGHKDMDFSVLDERFQDKICAIFQVPKILLGISTDVNRATADAAQYVFGLWAVKPQMELIVDTLNEFFIPQFTNEPLALKFESPVPEDRAAELEEYKTALGGQSYMSVNEVRELEGLTPVKNGDSVMTTFNMVELGTPAPKPGIPEDTEDGKVMPVRRSQKSIITRHTAHRQKRVSLMQTASEKIAGGISELLKGINFDEIAHKGFVQRVDQYAKLTTERMQKIGKKFEADVLANFDDWMKSGKGMSDDQEATLAAIVKALTPVMNDLAEKEGQVIFDNFKLTEPFKVTPKLAKTLKEKIELMAKSYDETTRDLIEKEIARGLEEKLSIDQIKENVKSNVFDYTNDVRAEMIANTETFKLANIGIRDAYEQTKVVKTVRWYTAEDDTVCPFCAEMDGRSVGVSEVFLNKGDTLEAGNQSLSLDYDEVLGGGLHPNCRCYVRADKIEQ